MTVTPIAEIQGCALRSPLSGKEVMTTGVVIGLTSKGFFLQDTSSGANPKASRGIFVYGRRFRPPLGALVSAQGKVVDFQPKGNEHERPTTQIGVNEIQVIEPEGPHIDPVWLTAAVVPESISEQAEFLNSLEGMLVGIEAGATFIAPSNAYGDYVVLPKGSDVGRTPQGGVIIDPTNPLRWFPGFRIHRYESAPRVNVGAELLSPVIGPLNFRASSYQIVARGEVRVRNTEIALERTTLRGGGAQSTILTLNVFNLDEQVERADRVKDRRRDIDDDEGDQRYRLLAETTVVQASAPDIVALQEMQDNDGAEFGDSARANQNYELLVSQIRQQGGPHYEWADIPPEVGADGGQPGGNIRNGFLFNPTRMLLVPGTLRRIAEDHRAFEGSRKALVGRFRLLNGGQEIVVINVHLASKRHQNSIFSETNPGYDSRLDTRVEQAEIIRKTLTTLHAEGVAYYVTGDFNDFEFSPTLLALEGTESVNVVRNLPGSERFDYNHRGLSQALMHGVVSKTYAANTRYEVLHGSDLVGVRPGEVGGRATDHACVVARITL
jgi:predicted extracellular nuclease